MRFFRGFLVIVFTYAILITNVVPLELFPHSHTGQEQPVHNNFDFVPKEIISYPTIAFNLSIQEIEPVNYGIKRLVLKYTNIFKTSRSPPTI